MGRDPESGASQIPPTATPTTWKAGPGRRMHHAGGPQSRRITTCIQVLSRNENQSKELSELRKKRGRREGGKWERKGDREGRGKKEKKGRERGREGRRGEQKKMVQI